MKKFSLLFLLFVLAGTSSCAQNPDKEAEFGSSMSCAEPAVYQLIPTQNMWKFIKLNTATGRMWRVQYSTKGDEYRFQEPMINSIGIGFETLRDSTATLRPGRFALYPTQNMYNFILLDQQNGNIWQVQYPRDSEQIIPIK